MKLISSAYLTPLPCSIYKISSRISRPACSIGKIIFIGERVLKILRKNFLDCKISGTIVSNLSFVEKMKDFVEFGERKDNFLKNFVINF